MQTTRSTLILVVIALVLAAAPGPARANSAGIIDQYGPSKICMNCHLPGSMMNGTIKLTSPAYTGLKYTFSFSCAGAGASGALPVSGVDVYATCGKLSVNPAEPLSKLVSGQIIHSKPKATTGNAVTWTFDWTAPATSTGCAFHITGLLGDNDKKVGGDVSCMAMKGLLVLDTPDGGPPPVDAAVKQDAAVKKDAAAKQDAATKQDAVKGDLAPGQEAGPQPGDAAAVNDVGPSSDGAAGGDSPPPPTLVDDGCSCRVDGAPRRGAAPAGLYLALLIGLAGLTRRRR